ncbi:hypothetical protein SPBRAN_1644 [uncultured Candidatus Thioglobus sp.]|nr:hypothetical protein SPBRAN_1644 [uncultured Candidatus Thioglobus sp.]
MVIGNNNFLPKRSAGFTLIELLVVVAIVSVLVSLAGLSIRLAQPSAVSVLGAKIQQKIASAQNHSQFYNRPIRLLFDEKKIQVLTPQKSLWKPSQSLPALEFGSVNVSADVDVIEILPNGFITRASIILSQGDDTYSLESIADER